MKRDLDSVEARLDDMDADWDEETAFLEHVFADEALPQGLHRGGFRDLAEVDC